MHPKSHSLPTSLCEPLNTPLKLQPEPQPHLLQPPMPLQVLPHLMLVGVRVGAWGGDLGLGYAQLGDLVLVTPYWDELGGVHRSLHPAR